LSQPLPSSFFNQDTLSIAKQLLGMELIHNTPYGNIGGMINETEAYTQDDPACHAYNGKKTTRNAPMFLCAGHLYIYFIYGMYHCINIVTEPKGTGAAVLIRSVIPTIGIEHIKKNRPKVKTHTELLNGPAKLMIGLSIPNKLNGIHLTAPNCPIQLLPAKKKHNIIALPRVGISKAIHKPWRFVLKS
jgi:DNA-3-methyladenine glycosylase